MADGDRDDARMGRDARVLDKQITAFELRKQGYSYREIAAAMGKLLRADGKSLSPKTAWQYVHKEMEKRRRLLGEHADHVRILELERLDRWLTKLEKAINVGDRGAIETALKIQTRRSHLLGLDAPKKLDVRDLTNRPDEQKASDEIDRELAAVRLQIADAESRSPAKSNATH